MRKGSIVRIVSGSHKGRTGVCVRISGCGTMASIVITGYWDHGIWFNFNELKVIGGLKKEIE